MAVSAPTADFVKSTLNGAITAGATSATIGAGLNIPATNGVLQIDYDSALAVGVDNGPETIFYTAYTSGTGALSGITRGVAGTTGVAHANGAKVQQGPSTYHYSHNMIGNTDLSTSAITLGYAEITSQYQNTTYAGADITGLTTTVTVPSGGRRLKVTGFLPNEVSSNAVDITLSIQEDGNTIGSCVHGAATSRGIRTFIASKVASAGSHTYKIRWGGSGATTFTVDAAATAPAFILVELI